MPMPSDFAIRLAGGLALALLITPPRLVPPAFFRTIMLVALGLFVAAGLTSMGANGRWGIGGIVAAAVLSYLASALWGLGLLRVAIPATFVAAAIACGLIVGDAKANAFNAASRLSSAALLGSALAAMLLGHHYLTAPAMSIAPLRRFVLAMGVTLIIRATFAAVGLSLALGGDTSGRIEWLFLMMRWGMGVAGPAVATILTWQTVRIRSTQSATGILYIAVTLVLFGELAGMILRRGLGVEL